MLFLEFASVGPMLGQADISTLAQRRTNGWITIGMFTGIQQEQQSTLIKMFKKNEEYNPMGPKTKSVNRALAKMIALDKRTFTSNERQGFKELVKILDPKARLPSRNHILEKYLVPLSNITAAKLTDSMSHAEAHAFTTDVWAMDS